jgi:hypothetical protein
MRIRPAPAPIIARAKPPPPPTDEAAAIQVRLPAGSSCHRCHERGEREHSDRRRHQPVDERVAEVGQWCAGRGECSQYAECREQQRDDDERSREQSARGVSDCEGDDDDPCCQRHLVGGPEEIDGQVLDRGRHDVDHVRGHSGHE